MRCGPRGWVTTVPHELFKLIARYRWLQQELAEHNRPGGAANAAHVTRAIEEVFLQIVEFQADDASISYCQIEFLLSMLTDATRDRKLRQLLRDVTLAHVKRLADRAVLQGRPA